MSKTSNTVYLIKSVLRYINTRDQSNVEGVEDILQILSYFKALNAMYVEDVINVFNAMHL